MKFQLTKFRTFKTTQTARIAPLTILTGENSAGKSSFLAGYRFLCEMCSRTQTPSFNKEPFFLGSYNHIAHYRGGQYGRASDFEFAFRTDEDGRKSSRLNVTFKNSQSQPVVKRISFNDANDGLKVEFPDTTGPGRLSLTGSKPIEIQSDAAEFFPNAKDAVASIHWLTYGMRDVFIGEEDIDPVIENRLRKLSLSLSRFLRLPPQQVLAGAPMRTRPRRTYDPVEGTFSAEGDHAPIEIARASFASGQDWSRIKEPIEEFGRMSGLFDTISVKHLGKSGGDPFQIYLQKHGPRTNIVDLGYGVSQVLPIIYDLASIAPRASYLLQQPEVHLHPQAQAALGEFIVNLTPNKRSNFIVETHSDYFVDRVRRVMRDREDITAKDVSILYFEKEDLDSKVHEIALSDRGEILKSPAGYRSFFAREAMRNLGL